jgi:hypothetical protein
VGERFLRNLPTVAQQHNVFFYECLTAQLVGYGTNGVPNPSYIDRVAWWSADFWRKRALTGFIKP